MTLLQEGIFLLENNDENTDFSDINGNVVDPTIIVIYLDKMKLSKYRNVKCINPVHVDCDEKKSKILVKYPVVFDGTNEDFAKVSSALLRYMDENTKEK